MSSSSISDVLYNPALLVHALDFVAVDDALRMASLNHQFHHLILTEEGSYLWHRYYFRRWLFGLGRTERMLASKRGRRKGRTVINLNDYRERHLITRHWQEGKAGQYKVKTIRDQNPATSFRVFLFLSSSSENEEKEAHEGAGESGEGGDRGSNGDDPEIVVGCDDGSIRRYAYLPTSSFPAAGSTTSTTTAATTFARRWKYQPLLSSSPSPITALAVEGKLLACGSQDGRLTLLDLETGHHHLPPHLPPPPSSEATGFEERENEEGSGSRHNMVQKETGLAPLTSLLFLENGQALAVASSHHPVVKTYDIGTGEVREEIRIEGGGGGPLQPVPLIHPVPPQILPPPYEQHQQQGGGVLSLLKHHPSFSSSAAVGKEGSSSSDSGSKKRGSVPPKGRSHFMVLCSRQASFYVQDPPLLGKRKEEDKQPPLSASTTPSSGQGANVPPSTYTEHGRIVLSGQGDNDAMDVGEGFSSRRFTRASFLDKVISSMEEEWRVILGDNLGQVHVSSFTFRPRIHLASLLGPIDPRSIQSPLHQLHQSSHSTAITAMQIYQRNSLTSLIGIGYADGSVRTLLFPLFSSTLSSMLHAEEEDGGGGGGGRIGQEEQGELVVVMEGSEHQGSITSLCLDAYKVVSASRDHSMKVWALPHSTSASSSSSSSSTSIKSLYTLLGGSNTLGGSRKDYPKAVTFGDTEVLAAFQDKIRLYDFSPPCSSA